MINSIKLEKDHDDIKVTLELNRRGWTVFKMMLYKSRKSMKYDDDQISSLNELNYQLTNLTDEI